MVSWFVFQVIFLRKPDVILWGIPVQVHSLPALLQQQQLETKTNHSAT